MRNRDFNMEDTLLIQRSRTIRGHFINELPRFTAFDPDLNAAFAANWLLSIDECEAHPTDETTVDQLQQHTDELEQAIKEGFTAANELEHYVKKAFQGDKEMLEEFGFHKRTQARNRTLNLLIWLEVMKRVAADYTAELAAVNMPPAMLTTLDTKQQNCVQKEIAQEYFKRIRKRMLRQRIKKFNNLYSYFVTVNSAAQLVFINEPEERGLFAV